MRSSRTGFTLMEILIAMGVLLVGLIGILKLFPEGLKAGAKAIEETNAALLAESLYASLRTSAQRVKPYENTVTNSGKLIFFFDGVDITQNVYPRKDDAYFRKITTSSGMSGKTFGIPRFHNSNGGTTQTPVTDGTPIDIFAANNKTNYLALEEDFCKIGQKRESNNYIFNVMRGSDNDTAIDEANIKRDGKSLGQYSYNIQILCPTSNPTSLYDVIIYIRRENRSDPIKKFYTQLMIPTTEN